MANLIYLDGERCLDFNNRLQKTKLYLQYLALFPGCYVGLSCNTNLTFLLLYQACFELQYVPVIIATASVAAGLGAHIIETANGLKVTTSSSIIKPASAADIRVVTQTSGTTGQPRYIAWHEHGIQHQNHATAHRLDYHHDSKSLVTVPLWSSYGLSLIHLWQAKKMDLVLLSQITPRVAIHAVKTCNATCIDAVPRFYTTWLKYLTYHPKEINHLASMELYGCGGDYLHPSLSQAWFEQVNLPLLDGYGLSEAGPNVAINGPSNYQLETVGKPLAEIEITFDEDEIIIQSPSLMHDDWRFIDDYNAPLKDKLNTGDLGILTKEGFLKILGRKKNIIIMNGHNIYPEQVENVLRHYPGLQAVAVVPVDLNNKTRLVACMLHDHPNFNKKACIAWCEKQLTKAAVPHFFLLMDELPTNANGKIDRRLLSTLASETLRTDVRHAVR